MRWFSVIRVRIGFVPGLPMRFLSFFLERLSYFETRSRVAATGEEVVGIDEILYSTCLLSLDSVRICSGVTLLISAMDDELQLSLFQACVRLEYPGN